VETRCKRGGRR
jgi:hypothetical protein